MSVAFEKNKREREKSRNLVEFARSYALLIVLSIIWGIAFVAIRVADFELSPVNLALLRWLVASAGYLAILPFVGRLKTRFERKDLSRLLIVSFANVPAYHLSLNFGETSVSSGLAGLLVSLGPVFIVLLSRISLKEEIGRTLVVALVIASFGAVLLSIQDLSGGGSIFGPLEVVVTALFYAVFSVLSKPLVEKYGALPVAIRAGIIGTLMLLPLLFTGNFENQVSSLSVAGWVSVLYLSLLSTVIGYSMFYILLSRGAVSRLSVQLYLVPVVSVIGGIVLLGEKVTAFTVLGGGIMLFAVALATRSRSGQVTKATGKDKI